MPQHFCTYFDWRYLARGLVLYRSLAQHCENFTLRVFCMDGRTKAALDRLNLPHLIAIQLAELEAHDPALLAVKGTRTPVEYYWTATPAICLYSLERETGLEHIVYLDADLKFYADPAPLFDELGDGSILLMPHLPASEFGEGPDRACGRFNVAFEVFRRDENGLSALHWWHDRCIEWCYERHQAGRYGDQKYLDDWPERFAGVQVSRHPGAGVAAWNVGDRRLEPQNGRLLVDGRPLIFHHFSSLELHPADPIARWIAGRSAAYRLTPAPAPLVWTTGWRVSERELDLLWDPYVADLGRALGELQQVTDAGVLRPPSLRLRRAAFQVARRRLPRRLRAAYWRARWALGG
jgi:hypothetical protein